MKKITLTFSAICISIITSACSNTLAYKKAPLIISDQGVFSAGGSVVGNSTNFEPYNPKTQNMTIHGDHATVFYQIPKNAHKYPLVFLHGAGQSMRTWQTTPDGREGIQNILLRNNYSVYLLDQPRRGQSGRTTIATKISDKGDDQLWYGQFRIGLYPNYYKNSQFAEGKEALNNFFRQMTPNTGPYDTQVIADAVVKVFDKLDNGGILVSHSQGGGPGFLAAMRSKNIKAVVSYEPGSAFPFPKGEAPNPIENNGFFGPVGVVEVPMEDFMELTHKPIIIYYGDYIPKKITKNPYQDFWRAVLIQAKAFANKVNAYGGNAKVVHLPDLNIYGNTHFLFSDKNNQEVINLLLNFLHENKFDN